MKYHFKIHKDDNKYWAECLEISYCYTQAETLEELYNNMQAALNLYIEEPENSKDLAPLPNPNIKETKKIVAVSVSPTVALAFLIRYYRIKNGLTQKQLAEKLGFKSIFNYQRLESSQSNPTFSTLQKLHYIFPNFSIDFAL